MKLLATLNCLRARWRTQAIDLLEGEKGRTFTKIAYTLAID